MPTSYIPDEDQGILLVQVRLPSGSTLEQTEAVIAKVRSHFLENEKEAVESCMTISGIGFAGQAQNMAMIFVKLKDWQLRKRPDLKVEGHCWTGHEGLLADQERQVFAFPPPSVIELGMATGFDFQLLDRGGLGH